MRPALRDAWHQALLRCDGEKWHLQEILRATPVFLAAEWLIRCVSTNRDLWRYDDAIEAALEGMGTEDRRTMLLALPVDVIPPALVRELVNGDASLFQTLLEVQAMKRVHLAPLIGHPNPTSWALLAEAALAAGYSANEIAEAAYGHIWEWSGSESAMWKDWGEHFATLRGHPNEQIREIGRIGEEIAAGRRDRALESERTARVRR